MYKLQENKMISYNDAAKLLGLCNIPHDIQKQILLLFIGFGTPTSSMIKLQTKLTDFAYNGSLVERIILENDTFTLWRLKVLLSNAKVFQTFTLKNLRVLYELRIAYLSDGNCELKRIESISSLLGAIKTNSDTDLFGMFYNLDKNHYKYLGTPTANVIHNAITNKIINEIDPMIWEEPDPDARYY